MAYALRSKLNPAFRDVFQKCQLLKRNVVNVESQCRSYAARGVNEDEEVKPPTKFTTSRANSLTAQAARERTTRDDSPWAQTISVMLSLAAFLIYFGILREPNDLDELIERDISDQVPGLKESHEKLRTTAGRQAGRATVLSGSL